MGTKRFYVPMPGRVSSILTENCAPTPLVNYYYCESPQVAQAILNATQQPYKLVLGSNFDIDHPRMVQDPRIDCILTVEVSDEVAKRISEGAVEKPFIGKVGKEFVDQLDIVAEQWTIHGDIVNPTAVTIDLSHGQSHGPLVSELASRCVGLQRLTNRITHSGIDRPTMNLGVLTDKQLSALHEAFAADGFVYGPSDGMDLGTQALQLVERRMVEEINFNSILRLPEFHDSVVARLNDGSYEPDKPEAERIADILEAACKEFASQMPDSLCYYRDDIPTREQIEAIIDVVQSEIGDGEVGDDGDKGDSVGEE